MQRIDFSTFARAVRTGREKRGVTQATLAAEAGVGVPFISGVENGTESSASPETVVRIADALRISRRRLLALGAPKKRYAWDEAMKVVGQQQAGGAV